MYASRAPGLNSRNRRGRPIKRRLVAGLSTAFRSCRNWRWTSGGWYSWIACAARSSTPRSLADPPRGSQVFPVRGTIASARSRRVTRSTLESSTSSSGRVWGGRDTFFRPQRHPRAPFGGDERMPHYFGLGNWTDQGVRNVRESPKRIDAAKEGASKLGGRLEGDLQVGQEEFGGGRRVPNGEVVMQ